MKISLNIEAKGITTQDDSEGFMAAMDAVTALTKVGYWWWWGHHYMLSFLGTDKDRRTRLVGAIRNGNKTAFHISYGGDFMHYGDWILRINVSKRKEPFAFTEIHFDEHSGSVKKVLFHLLPPVDHVPLN